MLIPFYLLYFWYPKALMFFLRVWKNSLLFLEEDLAVFLMLKLLFVPLFHDSSIFGRIISFIFRSTRILLGIVALIGASLLIFILALIWFLAPVLTLALLFSSLPKELFIMCLVIVLFGLSLFINELINKPLLRLWHVKDLKDIWKSTKLSKKDIEWNKLSMTFEVNSFLKELELLPTNFNSQTIPLTDEVLQKALDLGKGAQAPVLTPAYFWVAMLYFVPNIEQELLKLNLRLEDFVGALSYFEYKRTYWKVVYLWDENFAIKHLKGVNRGWLGAPTPNLDAVSIDLTKLASKENLPDFVGRESTVSQVVNILSQSNDRNVLLVGEAGCGKTTLVNFLAKKILTGDAPESLATKRLVSLDFTKLLSSVTTEGELAEKVKALFEEVSFIQDIIIFVDEIHNMGVGEAGHSLNLYSLILPYLESNQFQFIAATEPENFNRIIEKNSNLARIFHKVEVPPSSVEETILAIQQRAVDLVRHKKIAMTYLAIKELVYMSHKLIHDRVLPDSALSMLDEAEVLGKTTGIINTAIVKEVLGKRVNVPILEVDSKQKEVLLNLEEVIHQKMIDQEQAVKAVADTLRRAAASLREEDRPIGSFLFVGPTGVGKTELAKTLAEVYFKSTAAFLRFDMSEYQTPEAVNRLIGTTENPGELTEAIAHKPYSLVLLDEFEKANKQILTLFLQVLDDGRLTDASGKTVDFSNTIIIATSNAASLIIVNDLKAKLTQPQIETHVKDELLKIFKPELINRFDEVVIFKPLTQKDLEKIVLIKLEALRKTLKDQGYLIEFTPKLISELARQGFDPILGARPLRRFIQDTLEAKLSRLILENKLTKGQIFKADIDLLT